MQIGTRHRTWCDPECGAIEEFDTHSNGPTIAAPGGPMCDDDPHATVDKTVAVSVEQADDQTASVLLHPEIWLRSPGSSWHIPGELIALLPTIRMSATRARYVAMLLMESAALADDINDGRAQSR